MFLFKVAQRGLSVFPVDVQGKERMPARRADVVVGILGPPLINRGSIAGGAVNTVAVGRPLVSRQKRQDGHAASSQRYRSLMQHDRLPSCR
jgi:hypothetical protein